MQKTAPSSQLVKEGGSDRNKGSSAHPRPTRAAKKNKVKKRKRGEKEVWEDVLQQVLGDEES